MMISKKWRFHFYKHALQVLLCLPLLYLQGKALYRRIPRLPAARTPEGFVDSGGGPVFQLLIIGESTMAGLGVEQHEDGFAGYFARSLSQSMSRPVEWRVFAQSGYTAQDVVQNIIPELKGLPADLIVIGLGGNDSFNLNFPSRWQVDTRNLIHRLRADFPVIPLAFLNLPPIRSFPAFTPLMQWALGNWVLFLAVALEELVSDFPSVYFSSAEISLEYMQQRLGLTSTQQSFFSDGVHPSAYTYELWAADFCLYLEEQEVLSFNH
jgi:lysophospholipase L1-like esterase